MLERPSGKRLKVLFSFLFLVGLVLGAGVTYAVVPRFSFTTIFEEGSSHIGCAWLIFKDGVTYVVRNGLTGAIPTTSSNFTYTIEYCIDNLPIHGGVIRLGTGYFEGQIVIDRSGVVIEGEGSFGNRPMQFYDLPSDVLYGTVIKPESGKDGVLISGANRSGIQIKNLGIWFTTPLTGDGITTDHGDYFQVEDLVIENIDVLHHDSLHYAICLENFIEASVRNINSYGGGLLRLYANWINFHSGDAVFENMYGRILYDLPSDPYAARGYPIIIARNGTRGDSWVNDLVCDTILINNPTVQTHSGYYGSVFWFLRASVLNHLHIEGVSSTNRTVDIGGCWNVQFSNAYFWTYVDCYINSQYTNNFVTWIGGYIGGDILDGNETDTWINCVVYGDIQTNTIANFVNLRGNAGTSTLTSGQATVTVSAKYIGPNSYVLLTIIEADTLTAGEGLKVSTINIGPTNTFEVQCEDEGTASTDINFYWQIAHVPA